MSILIFIFVFKNIYSNNLKSDEISKISNKKQACNLLEGTIITYYDNTYYVKGCRKRPISQLLFNEMQRDHKIYEINAKLFSLIPNGKEYEIKKRYDFKCEDYYGKYINSGNDFFYVDSNKCLKHRIENSDFLRQHNVDANFLVYLDESLSNKIPTGSKIKINKNVNDNSIVLEKMTGEPESSRLYRIAREDTDSSKGILDDRQSILESGNEDICKKFKKFIGNFYSESYYVYHKNGKCFKRKIENFSLDLQKLAAEKQIRILDINSKEYYAITDGSVIKDKEMEKILLNL